MLPRELIAASTKPLVLSLLARGESYGYEIIQQARAVSEERLEWTDGMLYPVLHRLEREGLVVSEWKAAENGRHRKYYRLTSRGQDSLRQDRQQWLSVHETLTKAWKLCSI